MQQMAPSGIILTALSSQWLIFLKTLLPYGYSGWKNNLEIPHYLLAFPTSTLVKEWLQLDLIHAAVLTFLGL